VRGSVPSDGLVFYPMVANTRGGGNSRTLSGGPATSGGGGGGGGLHSADLPDDPWADDVHVLVRSLVEAEAEDPGFVHAAYAAQARRSVRFI
jgi:hypothetical protein